jgi:hypothetical protein
MTLRVDAGEKVDFLAGLLLLGVLIRLISSGYRICGLRLISDLDVDATEVIIGPIGQMPGAVGRTVARRFAAPAS